MKINISGISNGFICDVKDSFTTKDGKYALAKGCDESFYTCLRKGVSELVFKELVHILNEASDKFEITISIEE